MKTLKEIDEVARKWQDTKEKIYKDDAWQVPQDKQYLLDFLEKI